MFVTIINGDAAGNVRLDVVPGEDNEMEVLYGSVFNGEAGSARRFIVEMLTPSNDHVLGVFMDETVNAQARLIYPWYTKVVSSGPDQEGRPMRAIVSGPMIFTFFVVAVGAGVDIELGVVARVRGIKPIVSGTTAGTGGTITIDVDELF